MVVGMPLLPCRCYFRRNGSRHPRCRNDRHHCPPRRRIQRGSRQVRDRCLQRIVAIVQREQCVPPEGNDDRLFLDRQDGRLRIIRKGGKIADSRTLLPLGDHLGVDAVALGLRPQLS